MWLLIRYLDLAATWRLYKSAVCAQLWCMYVGKVQKKLEKSRIYSKNST